MCPLRPCLCCFLLFTAFILIESQEVNHAAVGSTITFCFQPCKWHTLYKIYHGNVAIHVLCNASYLIPNKYNGRISVNESTGCFTLSNITKRDGGIYTLEHKNGDGYRESQRQIRYEVHDGVWIKELSRNDTGAAISLTMVCAGNPDAVTWIMDGEDLRDRSWLSDDNRTLTVPNNITGTFTVHVSNPVSADSKNITLVKDLIGKSNPLGVVMYPNITKVIWDEGGGWPSNQTLVLSRNVTNLYVLTPSGKFPRVQAFTGKHDGWILVGCENLVTISGTIENKASYSHVIEENSYGRSNTEEPKGKKHIWLLSVESVKLIHTELD